MAVEYPEIEKLKSVSEESQKIGQFLDWLNENGIQLCKWKEAETNPVYYPAHYWEIPDSFEKLLACRVSLPICQNSAIPLKFGKQRKYVTEF